MFQEKAGNCAIPNNNQSLMADIPEVKVRCSDCSRVTMNYEECGGIFVYII